MQSLSFSSRFGEHYFLASSSQDTYVRVWRFGNGLSRNTSNSIFNVDEVLSDAAISLKPRYLPVSMESNGAGRIFSELVSEFKIRRGCPIFNVRLKANKNKCKHSMDP